MIQDAIFRYRSDAEFRAWIDRHARYLYEHATHRPDAAVGDFGSYRVRMMSWYDTAETLGIVPPDAPAPTGSSA